LCATLEVILKRPVRVVLRGDNDAACIACRKGYSRKLGYIKKHQKCSLSAMRHVFVGGEPHETDLEPSVNVLARVDTKKNRSDLGTKPLDHVVHWGHMIRILMRSLAEIRKMR
jgi:hypothetical protein